MAETDGDYQLVKVLGRGAFGEAALYRRLEDNSLVVWKEILLMNATEKQRHHANQEASLLSLLDHPNIVAYYNDFMDGSTLLIEMEYANGGTLNRKIYTGLANDELFAERWILWMFYQIMSAIIYIHARNIIHRDIKSLNIFLTKLGLCKLGDFGLARSLSGVEMQAVTTNVGTLAYMSPEIHKGETYNEGSDVWAAGCVLYEMVCRSLPFAATEIGRLVVDIVESTPKEVPRKYSAELRALCRRLLIKDPARRPSMATVLASLPFSQLKGEFGPEVIRLDRNSTAKKKRNSSMGHDSLPVVTSKSSEAFIWGGGKHVPQRMETLVKDSAAVQVSSGVGHFAAVTVEKELYTWAIPSGTSKMSGQLGHGDLAKYRLPKRVESLLGQAVIQVSCGDEFTVCTTDDGRLLAFGSNYWGCLGNGEEVETDSVQPKPTPVPFFTAATDGTRVKSVAAGASFVFALTFSGDVYSWGNGDMGQLGLGSEECFSSPQLVKLPPGGSIRRITCGVDNTFLVMRSGRLLACGSNESNKSCLDPSFGPRRASLCTGDPVITTVHMQMDFQPVKALSRYKVVDIAAGSTHAAAIDAFGHLFTFGDNSYGQLGLGHFRAQRGAKRIAGTLLGKHIVHASCGDSFTMVATADQQVYSWGRGDHGQLCSTADSSSSLTHGSQRTGNALPRPVFSALHVVSSLSCKHWHGIMIAEKVLSKRKIQAHGSVRESDDVDGSFSDSSPMGYRPPAGMDTEEVPSWVADELAQSVIVAPSKNPRLGCSHRISAPAGVMTRQHGQDAGDVDPNKWKETRSQSASAIRTQSPVRTVSKSPVGHRAGSPGRQAVLSCRGPSAAGVHSQRQSSPTPPPPSAASPVSKSGVHSPLMRSSSAGRPNAQQPPSTPGMTDTEQLQQQVVDLRHERNMWRQEAEDLRGNKKQLMTEIDVASNKIADLQKMNQRLEKAHRDMERLFREWLNECSNAVQAGANSAGQAGGGAAAAGSVSPSHIHEPRSFGAPAFVRIPKSPAAGRRRFTTVASSSSRSLDQGPATTSTSTGGNSSSSTGAGSSSGGGIQNRRQSLPLSAIGSTHTSPTQTLQAGGAHSSGTVPPVTSPNHITRSEKPSKGAVAAATAAYTPSASSRSGAAQSPGVQRYAPLRNPGK